MSHPPTLVTLHRNAFIARAAPAKSLPSQKRRHGLCESLPILHRTQSPPFPLHCTAPAKSLPSLKRSHGLCEGLAILYATPFCTLFPPPFFYSLPVFVLFRSRGRPSHALPPTSVCPSSLAPYSLTLRFLRSARSRPDGPDRLVAFFVGKSSRRKM